MAKSKKLTKDETAAKVPGHTTKYDYVLGWISEAVDARTAQNAFIERAVMAYQGRPSINRYSRKINNLAESLMVTDRARAEALKSACSDLPDKGSMVIHNAVETIVSMAMGGVGRYEFGPSDPDLKANKKVYDRIAAAAKDFYDTNRVDSLLPQLIRNAVTGGVGYWHVKQKNGKKCLTAIEASRMLTDPKRFKTNSMRFIGFTQRESFRAIKERTRKVKGGGYVLKTLNEAEVYVSQLQQEINNCLTSGTFDNVANSELRKDLDTFYKAVLTRSAANTQTDDPDKMYAGDEVEIAYLYDQMNDLYFEVINRRYIIIAKTNPLTRDIKCDYYDPTTGKNKTKTKTVKLEHPFVELPYIKTFWDKYPIAPLFYILDDFDDLCAMESVHYHNLSVMAPVTFVGQSNDTEKTSRIASIAGETVEGLPQTFGVLSKTHDISATVTAIQRYEERIKRVMKAVDPFELQGMIGDRATAKEVVSASGQVSQGINPFIANIETAMVELGEVFIKLELIMGDKETYSFSHNGEYAEVSRSDLAGDYDIRAKLVTSIKLEQEANSRKALELIQYLGNTEGIDKKKMVGRLVPIVLGSLITRQEAEEMILPEYRPMPEEVIARIKMQAEKEARRDEADRMNLDEYTPEELDKMTGMFSRANASEGQMDYSNMPGVPIDPTALPVSAVPTPGMPPASAVPSGAEQAGIVANDPTGNGYAA